MFVIKFYNNLIRNNLGMLFRNNIIFCKSKNIEWRDKNRDREKKREIALNHCTHT